MHVLFEEVLGIKYYIDDCGNCTYEGNPIYEHAFKYSYDSAGRRQIIIPTIGTKGKKRYIVKYIDELVVNFFGNGPKKNTTIRYKNGDFNDTRIENLEVVAIPEVGYEKFEAMLNRGVVNEYLVCNTLGITYYKYMKWREIYERQISTTLS